FFGAGKWRCIPAPIASGQELQIGITILKARDSEMAVRLYPDFAAPQRPDPLHLAFSDEVAGLGEIAARPHHTPAERFALRLIAELHVPCHAGCVADEDLRLRSGEVLPDEGVRGFRRGHVR